jgi:hypothetical protein
MGITGNKTSRFAGLALLALLAAPAAARADYVDRPITLPSGQWALGVGLGIGHDERPEPLDDITGFGVNLELKGGLTPGLQVGLRTGLRLGSEGRLTQADNYGRTFETETYGVGIDDIANPELSLRAALFRGDLVALALEGRLYLPIEDGTELGIMIALPLHIHLGHAARLDSGLYVPIIFTDPRISVISVPFHVWFQASPDLAVGVLTGVRRYRPGGGTSVPLGVGLNYELSGATDLRTWLLFPNVRGGGTEDFGGGVALELRF